MPQDDSGSEPPRIVARRGHDTHDTDGDVRPPSRRENEARKLQALLEVIEFSGVDLLNLDDKTEFTERLAQAKRTYERRRQRVENRSKIVLKIIGTIAGGVLTVSLPEIWTWVKAHWP